MRRISDVQMYTQSKYSQLQSLIWIQFYTDSLQYHMQLQSYILVRFYQNTYLVS